MLKMCEKVTKIFRSRSTATVRTDFVGFSRRFSILGIRSRFQSPFLGLYIAKELPATNATARLAHFAFERYSLRQVFTVHSDGIITKFTWDHSIFRELGLYSDQRNSKDVII